MNDNSSVEILTGIGPHITSWMEKHEVWHKNCYASFTSKVNTERVQEQFEILSPNNLRVHPLPMM